MKEVVEFGPLLEREVGKSVLDQLTTIPGTHRSITGLVCGFIVGDPRIQKIIDILSSAGCRPRTNMYVERGPDEYIMGIRREYDLADLEACAYLTLDAPEWTGCEFPPGEIIELQIKDRHKKRDIASVGSGHIVVCDRLCNAIERAAPLHTRFKETMLTNGFEPEKRHTRTWSEVGAAPWWELASDLTLPPLSSRCTLVDTKGQPYRSGATSGGCWLVEGFYHPAEMHYRRNDLAKVGEFDVALTHEQFGFHPNNAHPFIVISQRVYRLIREHDRKATFVPVRIDDE